MGKVNLYYWNGHKNFGDVLSAKLIEELSGCKTQLKIYTSFSVSLKRFTKALFHLDFIELKKIEYPWQTTLYAVGSILKYGNKKSLYWGSGFMKNSESFKGGHILAVRGKYTDKKLQKDGFAGCQIYGDPALLLPLWIKPKQEKKFRLGIIPHWKEVDYFLNNYGNSYKIIDLRTDDIHEIIEEISSCEYILSTSLHGVIVSHAYNIPALWIQKGNIDTDGFKFYDYFSSVGIEVYDGFKDIKAILSTDLEWMSLFNSNLSRSKIQVSLNNIQIELLKVAPFPLKDKYRNLI